MEKFITDKLDECKQGDEHLSNEMKIIELFRGFFEKIVEVADMVSKRFMFKTSERNNSARFGNWVCSQVNIALGEMISNLHDDYLSSEKKMTVLHRRLSVEFNNYDVKGLSCGFLLDECIAK